MDPWERHDVLAGVVLSDLQPSAMLTGPTAAYLLGLPRPKVYRKVTSDNSGM